MISLGPVSHVRDTFGPNFEIFKRFVVQMLSANQLVALLSRALVKRAKAFDIRFKGDALTAPNSPLDVACKVSGLSRVLCVFFNEISLRRHTCGQRESKECAAVRAPCLFILLDSGGACCSPQGALGNSDPVSKTWMGHASPGKLALIIRDA